MRLTVDHFLEFLDTLLAIHSLEGVDIVAHSMGNRLLAAAVARLADARGEQAEVRIQLRRLATLL